MHGQFYTDTVGPGSKDHLALTTAFACTVGWSLKPGFTVLGSVQLAVRVHVQEAWKSMHGDNITSLVVTY